MKTIRAAVAMFLLAVFLAGTASANTSSINPNVPAQNSPLSSSVLRGNFGNAYTDENTIYGIFALSSNQLLGTINAGNAGPLNLPTCSTGALSWTPGTGFGCNSLSGLVSPITQSLVFTGQIGIDLNATGLPTKQTGTVLQLGNADGVASRIENDAFASAAYFTGVRSDGTNAAPTTLQNLDEISGTNAWGYNGSSVVGPRASVREFAAQNWTGSAQGTRIDISTTPNNTTAMAPVCGFENDGGVTCPPTVTGGSQGAGKINAAGLFVNGVAVSTGSNAFSSLTAAIATNSVENAAFTQTWAWDGVTTQTALTHTSTTITTGELANFSIVNAASTGYAGYFSNTGTAIAYGVYATEAGAANTGYAGYFNNTATATGYALYANGTATINGNLTVTGTCTGCGGGGSVTAVTFANTTAGAPAAGFTGVHQRLANAFSLTATGTDALTVTSTGGIGIGTTTPASPLDVESSSFSQTIPALTVAENTDGVFEDLANFFTPNMATSHNMFFLLGRSNSTNNSGGFSFYYAGSGSINNNVYASMNGTNAGFYLFGNGHFRITNGTSQPVVANADQLDVEGGIGLAATTSTLPTNGLYSPSANALWLNTAGAAALKLDSSSNVTVPGTLTLGSSFISPAARVGTFVCTSGGTITISNTNETATSNVIISLNAAGGTISTAPAMKTVTGGTGFTVLCATSDTSTYNYDILN